jgi:hypothetical protein
MKIIYTILLVICVPAIGFLLGVQYQQNQKPTKPQCVEIKVNGRVYQLIWEMKDIPYYDE